MSPNRTYKDDRDLFDDLDESIRKERELIEQEGKYAQDIDANLSRADNAGCASAIALLLFIGTAVTALIGGIA